MILSRLASTALLLAAGSGSARAGLLRNALEKWNAAEEWDAEPDSPKWTEAVNDEEWNADKASVASAAALEGIVSAEGASAAVAAKGEDPFPSNSFGARRLAADGCYPAYVSGGDYVKGDIVSAKGEITTTVDCDPATAGCPDTGKKAVTTTVTYNYECDSEYWCSNSGYAPGGINSNLGWEKDGEPCVGTAVIVPPSAPLPLLGGCPAEFSDSGDYGAGDRVSVCKAGNDWCTIYQCKSDAPRNSLWCSMTGYEPGVGAASTVEQAWEKLEGSCSGTISPTGAPSFDPANVLGGCPLEYDSGTKYVGGDRVSKDNFVFECKPWPMDGWCSLPGYEPLEDVATPDAWKEAWDMIGYCMGSIAPTSAPNFVSLQDLGGCPADWELRDATNPYEEGDRVAKDGFVFECKMWPFSGHCGQAGYEPLENPATPDAWKDAWTIVGHCSGSNAPTGAPNFVSLQDLGGCPAAWEQGANIYDEGDRVVVDGLVFQCKAWPFSGRCGQAGYAPLESVPIPDAWKVAWTLVGYCSGTIAPTSSPVFDVLADDGEGCPAEYKSTTVYEVGDEVSYTVSASPELNIKYECTGPAGSAGFCNQGGPGSSFAFAWRAVGSCSGTMAPTPSPTGNPTGSPTGKPTA